MRFLSIVALVCAFLPGHIHCQKISEQLQTLGCTTLLDALNATGVLATLEDETTIPDVTLFAPTNDAFDNAGTLPEGDELEALLTYHAIGESFRTGGMADEQVEASLNGADIRLNEYGTGSQTRTAQGATLVEFNKVVDNGIIHVIGAVMSPPSGTIYEFISSTDRFSTLKVAIDATDLANALNSTDTPFTIFAPTNDAFDKVPEEDLNSLLEDPEALTEVLLNHGVADTLFSAGISNNDILETEGGANWLVIVNDDGVYLNDTDYAQVTGVDFSVTNGAVHEINRVLGVAQDDPGDSGAANAIPSLLGGLLALFVTLNAAKLY